MGDLPLRAGASFTILACWTIAFAAAGRMPDALLTGCLSRADSVSFLWRKSLDLSQG